jgi:hypothetical protein
MPNTSIAFKVLILTFAAALILTTGYERGERAETGKTGIRGASPKGARARRRQAGLHSRAAGVARDGKDEKDGSNRGGWA